MAYTFINTCARNLCKQTVLVQLIIENVVDCLLEHSITCSQKLTGSQLSLLHGTKQKN